MNQETLLDLVLLSQSGDPDALEQLMLYSYHPVSYLCRKLLHNEEAAREQTREVLQILATKLHTLQNPELFEKWICRITAARCVQMLPQLRWASEVEAPRQEELPIAGESLDAQQTMSAVEEMVDMLPDDPRTCILLLCCGGLNPKAIAQTAGYTPDAVRNHLNQGQAQLQEQLDHYLQLGTQFSGITSLADILHTAMYQTRTPESDVIPLVYGILGKEVPVPPDPEKQAIRILSIVLAVLFLMVLALCGVLFLRIKASMVPPETSIPTTTATTAATTAPTETTAETTVPETTAAETTQATEPTQSAATEATVSQVKASAPTASTPAQSGTGGSGSIPDQVPGDAPKTGEDGHTHRYLSTRTNFNCETGGTRRYLCHDCDYSYTVELAPSGSHNYIVVPAGPAGSSATCTKPGTVFKICTNCNAAAEVPDPDNSPALGHAYTETLVAPTASSQGYTLHTCTRCGDSYMDNYVDPIPAQTEVPEVSEPADGGQEET